MKKQTAVEWLVERLAENGILHSSDINQAKQMEREQIEQAFWAGDYNSADFYDARTPHLEACKQYYKQTYSK